MKPLISVVTVCLNSAKTIKSTIEGMLAQTYENYEYIIKDGGSTDGTVEIVKSYEKKFNGKLRLIEKKDTGIYNAMNQGITDSKGEIIGLINSDDWYAPETLSRVAEVYEKENDENMIVIGNMTRVTDEGEVIHKYIFSKKNVDKHDCFGHPAMFASKKAYDLVGLYDETYRLAADGDFQLRAFENPRVKIVLAPYNFTFMREGGATDSFKHLKQWFKERTRMKREHFRGKSNLKIYFEELFSGFKQCVKMIIPKKVTKILYKLDYKIR